MEDRWRHQNFTMLFQPYIYNGERDTAHFGWNSLKSLSQNNAIFAKYLIHLIILWLSYTGAKKKIACHRLYNIQTAL